MLLSELAPLVNAQQGVVYVMESAGDSALLKQLASFADPLDGEPRQYALGQGIVGQCALDRQRFLLADIPPDAIHIRSGLFEAQPGYQSLPAPRGVRKTIHGAGTAPGRAGGRPRQSAAGRDHAAGG